MASVARVERVRQALEQSGPMAKRLAMQQLSGIDLSDVWDILVDACKEIALYYGGAVVTGAVVGGAIGSLAFGAGAVPGAIAGGAAGSQVGMWVLTLLGLKDLAAGLTIMFPAAMEHYERGFREAWGAVPDNRRDFGIGASLPSGSSSAGAWHMGQGHVILVMAILTAVVAYLTRGGTTASLAQMARQSRQLGAKFANWAVKNEGRLLAHPQLQSRPNNSVALAMVEPLPTYGREVAATTSRARARASASEENELIGFTGAGTTKLDAAAEAAYSRIRAQKMTDVEAVGNSVGLSTAEATALKKQLFFGRHQYPLDGTTIVRQRFAADHEIAFAWNAAAKGELSAPQQSWLRQLADHELAERSFMAKGIPYLQQEAWNGTRFTGFPKGAHDLAPAPPKINFPGYETPLHLLD